MSSQTKCLNFPNHQDVDVIANGKLTRELSSGCPLALIGCEVIVTTMSKNSRIVAVVLSLTLAVTAGFNLSSPQVKQVLSSIASAVWGS
jgi:hypothetical protein